MSVPAKPMEPALRQRLQALAIDVREASRSARVVALEEVWSGSEDEFMEASACRAEAGCDDIAIVRDSGRVFLFSQVLMTRQYAQACMQTQCEDKRHVIAETVRAESLTYPRPTSLATFSEVPFLLSAETVKAAVAAFAGDQAFADIQQVSASDGTAFLYSSNHLTPAHARSLAEWIAVERDLHW